MKVSILIPARNEESTIAPTVLAARGGVARSEAEMGMRLEAEEWVIDDGSSDRTARLATEAGSRVLSLPRSRGKGAALTAGFRASSGDVIALLDADLGARAEQVHRLLTPVVTGACDMSIARFPKVAGRTGLGWAKGLAGWGIRRMTGLELSSPLSGQRALRRAVLNRIGDRFAPGWGVEVALTIDAACCGFRVVEIPVEMEHRVSSGRFSGAAHRASQLRDIGLVLVPRLLRRGERRQRA